MRQRTTAAAVGVMAGAAGVVAIVAHDAVLALVVLLTGISLMVLVLVVLQHRWIYSQLGLNRRRVRRGLELAEAADKARREHARHLNRVTELVERQSRQSRVERAELSRQLAATSATLQTVAARHEQELARMRAEMSTRLSALSQPSAAGAQSTAPTAAAGPRPEPASVPGEHLLRDLVLDASSPSVVLVLDSFAPGGIFAGIRTALIVAARVAMETHRPLRVVVMRDPAIPAQQVSQLLVEWLTREAGMPVGTEVGASTPSAPMKAGHHADDIWVVTYWATAHAVGNAVDAGQVEARRVLYLVQDFEPGFFPWGVQHSQARATYDRGYVLLINSEPLARYVRLETGRAIPGDHVFAPQVDEARLRSSAARWRPLDDPTHPRVLFYGRPSKPRNLYDLGVATLRAWVRDLPGDVRPTITVAGENVSVPDLGGRADVVVRGMLSLEDYYDELTRQDIALALMHSPHPSHLPLELPMAGIPTVTNALGDHRRPWVVGLDVAAATPVALASALDRARTAAAPLRAHTPAPLPAGLGFPLDRAVAAAVHDLRPAGSTH